MNYKKPAVNCIPGFPQLYVNYFFKKRRTDEFFKDVYGKDATLFELGRSAIWQAIRLLRLEKTDKILVPSYHCGVDIDAIVKAGVLIEYFKVDKNLVADIHDIQKRIQNDVKAIFIIHYFGFPQPVDYLRNLCNEKNIILIEDCAHALFSKYCNTSLGMFGDLSVFSQRKTLPIFDGGALLINNPRLFRTISTRQTNYITSLKRTAGLIFNHLGSIYNKNPVFLLLAGLKKKIFMLVHNNLTGGATDTLVFDVSMADKGMSNISKRIMEITNTEDVIYRRRRNYRYILDNVSHLRQIEIVYKTLPDGVCPLVFPIRIIGSGRREIQDMLFRNGISSYVFGERLHRTLPGIKYPDAERLSNEVLGIPVHQNIDIKELNYMLGVLKRICDNGNNVEN